MGQLQQTQTRARQPAPRCYWSTPAMLGCDWSIIRVSSASARGHGPCLARPLTPELQLPRHTGDTGATQLGQGCRILLNFIIILQKVVLFKQQTRNICVFLPPRTLMISARTGACIQAVFARVLFAELSFCSHLPRRSDTPGPAQPFDTHREEGGPMMAAELGAASVRSNLPSPPGTEAPGKGLRELAGGRGRVYGGCKTVTYLECSLQLKRAAGGDGIGV